MTALWALLVAGLVVCAAATAAAVCGARGDTIRDVSGVASMAVAGVLVAARARWVAGEKRAWAAFATAMALWTAGFALYFFVQRRAPAAPSASDLLWLAGYPGWGMGVLVLAHRRHGQRPLFGWLDGLLGALAVAAVAAAIVLQAVLSTLGGDGWMLLFALTYPVADMVLLGCLTTSCVGGGWRPGRSGHLLIAGVAVLVAADSIFLLLHSLLAYPALGGAWESLWVVAMALVALAAWRAPDAPRPTTRGDLRTLVAPVGFAALALAVIVASAIADLNLVAVLLAATALALALVRLLVTLRQTVSLEEASRLSRVDELTGLANRRGFLAEADELLARPDATCALLLMDLDQFKELNDTLGHHAGDALLRALGPRLTTCAGPAATVGRLGGDEFGVLAPDLDPDAAAALAQRLRRTLAAPFTLDGIAVQVEASIGIAAHPEHGADVATLLRHADLAMYEAKRLRGGHAVYTPGAGHTTRDQLGLATEVRRALARRELTLRYQPIADLQTCRLRSAEALVRWNHPERGELAPAAFLGAVERTGLMRELTREVLDQAIAQLAEWHRPGGPGWGMGVNVTATDLLDLAFVDEVRELLERHRPPAHRLKLEITEGILITDPTRAIMVLERLRELGVRIALDDFGTGYSSLTHLQKMPVDAIKIDRSFVATMASDPSAAAIVRSVVGLARDFALDVVVAEGVEDAETWRRLAALGCVAAQGYLLAKPLRAADLLAQAPAIEARARAAAVPFELRAATTPGPASAAPVPRTSPSA